MKKQGILSLMKNAASQLRENQFKGMDEAKKQALKMSKLMGDITAQEALVMTLVFDAQCEDSAPVSLDNIAQYLKCAPMDIAELAPAMESLVAKGYMVCGSGASAKLMVRRYEIEEDVFAAILEDRDVKAHAQEHSEMTQYDFINQVWEVKRDHMRDIINARRFHALVEQLEDKCTAREFIDAVKEKLPGVEDRAFFYDTCHDFAQSMENGKTVISTTLREIVDGVAACARHLKGFNDETHPTIASGLLEITGKDRVGLSPQGLKVMFGELAAAFSYAPEAKDRYELVDQIEDQVSFNDSEREKYEKRRKMHLIEDNSSELDIVRDLKKLVPDFDDRIIFYLVASNLVDDSSYCVNELSMIFPRREAMDIARGLKSGRSTLVKRDLVQLESEAMLNRAEITLTEKGRELFLGEDINLFEGNNTPRDVIKASDVAAKNLYFEPSLERQMSTITNALHDDKFQAMRKRLEEKHLPSGVAILLYGKPGTGKTESVLQMARLTGRDVMHVDISQSKSKWFGESEKIVKGIFNRYRKLCEKSAVKPILLFNEADAIFSKRKDSNSSNVAQTENAIQNIILEELEKLDGILIATTNMASNLDRAFERRFLYKVKFDAPTIEAKKQIWLDKMPSLNDEQAQVLASQFNLSGGEIDNIARKAMIDEVLTGQQPTVDYLERLCHEEKMGKKGTRHVGFC